MKNLNTIPGKTISFMINISQILLESKDTTDEYTMRGEVWRLRDTEPVWLWYQSGNWRPLAAVILSLQNWPWTYQMSCVIFSLAGSCCKHQHTAWLKRQKGRTKFLLMWLKWTHIHRGVLATLRLTYFLEWSCALCRHCRKSLCPVCLPCSSCMCAVSWTGFYSLMCEVLHPDYLILLEAFQVDFLIPLIVSVLHQFYHWQTLFLHKARTPICK